MKLLYVLLMLGLSVPALAQERTAANMSLAEQLGTAAGLAHACNAGKMLEDYEVISSRLLANKADTLEAEKEAYRSYAEAKFRSFKMHKTEPQMSCAEILAYFKKMDIFKFVVYADGSVKMNDGTLLKPKRPVPKPKRTKKK